MKLKRARVDNHDQIMFSQDETERVFPKSSIFSSSVSLTLWAQRQIDQIHHVVSHREELKNVIYYNEGADKNGPVTPCWLVLRFERCREARQHFLWKLEQNKPIRIRLNTLTLYGAALLQYIQRVLSLIHVFRERLISQVIVHMKFN